MTKEPIMIDTTKCIYNTFDGGGSQRTICTLDNNFCDCLRDTDCYFKQLKKLENEFEGHIEQVTDLEVKLYDKEQECEKYKQALQEIKKIAEQMNNECFYDDFDCEDCDMKKGCTHFNKKQILLKYEVLDV